MQQFSLLLGLYFFTLQLKAQSAFNGFAGACCCGVPTEMNFPGLDFEFAPDPPFGSFIVYPAGSSFGPWTVNRATIDHCEASHAGLSNGNPNGQSNFVDLHGSPGFGEISYALTGLTAGNSYVIEFWYAQNGSGWTSTGTLIIGGTWLNVSWPVSISGAVQWFKGTYMFIARGSSASMDFGSTGTNNFAGTLIDDIRIFECPVDQEKPEVLNPPLDENYFCDKEVPIFKDLLTQDNCDVSPNTKKTETKLVLDPCHYLLNRKWEITDDCGNTETVNQSIEVEDREGPQFTVLPKNKIIDCSKNSNLEFNNWINKNGDAVAIDNCGKINWNSSFDRFPKGYCDSVFVEFIAIDPCGNETLETAYFIIQDSTKPNITVGAQSKNYICVPNTLDSLRNWLANQGFAQAKENCSRVFWSNNFNGDSTKNDISVTFFAKDSCGNIDSTTAAFKRRSLSDTTRVQEFSCAFIQNSVDTFIFSTGSCDSIVLVEKIKRLSDSTYVVLNTCNPGQVQFDTLTLKNSNGCDSLVFNEYIFRSTPFTEISIQDCQFTLFTIDTLLLQGQYCDSLVITQKIPLRKDSTFLQETTCDKTKEGTFVFALKNILGCDSIVQIQTTFTSQQITLLSNKECNLQNTFIDTVIFSSSLCDSLVITTHIPVSNDTTQIQSTTCDAAAAGQFITRLVNQNGCDSFIIEFKVLLPSDSVYFLKKSCIFSETGVKATLLKNKFGCDSMVITETQFSASDTIHLIKQTCLLSEAGLTSLLLKNNSGCDSIIFTETQFIPSDTNFIYSTTCDLTKVLKDTILFTTNTCDSLVFRDIQFKASDTIWMNELSCNPALIRDDTLHLVNSKGCDSLVYHTVNFQALPFSYHIDSISCAGKMDGIFTFLNSTDFTAPFQLFYDQNPILNNTVTGITPGKHTFYIVDARQCVTDTFTVEWFEPTAFTSDLGNELHVDYNSSQSIRLQANKTIQHISWLPDLCNNCNPVEFIADKNFWLYSMATDNSGCTSLDSVFIRVRKKSEVYVPDVFSPNGDNINDYFYIIGEENQIVESMLIFDRWGELIFETHNVPVNIPKYGWNGQYNAKPMNPAVFVFYARVRINDKEVIELKSDLTLLK